MGSLFVRYLMIGGRGGGGGKGRGPRIGLLAATGSSVKEQVLLLTFIVIQSVTSTDIFHSVTFHFPSLIKNCNIRSYGINSTGTMRLSTTLLPLALSSFATASIFGGQQKVLDAELAVPGENPLEYCAKTDAYTLSIDKVDLIPNPPLP